MNIDREGLNHIINNFWERCKEVRRVDLWVEEYLQSQEAFIAHINGIFLVKMMGIKNKVKHVRKWALTLPVTLCSPSSL